MVNLNIIIQQIIEAYDKKLESGQQIIRAIIAEIVDFRIEFNERDAESSKVLDFFEQIRPEEYIRKIGTNERKIPTGVWADIFVLLNKKKMKIETIINKVSV